MVDMFPHWNYVINALSWLVILQWIGRDMERRRAAWLADDTPEPVPTEQIPIPADVQDGTPYNPPS